MTRLSRETASLATIEACNALKAEKFRKLSDDIPLWRFREVLTKLGTQLGLSGGTVVYALDLMGMLREADWRGDGRPVTFHSLRGYARKVGKSERTLCRYERQLILAGLVHRTIKHARRHGGQGDDTRRTGLDWRAFGASMPDLLAMLDRRAAYEARRLDLEARIRAGRRIVLGLAEAMEKGRAVQLRAQLAEIGVLRLDTTLAVDDLQTRLGALTLLRGEIEDSISGPLDNLDDHAPMSGQSDNHDGRIDDTDIFSCPQDIRSETATSAKPTKSIQTLTRVAGNPCMEEGKGTQLSGMKTNISIRNMENRLDTIPLAEIWHAAPAHWKATLGVDVEISWPTLIELADHLAPRLGVSAYAWSGALRALGPVEASLSLMILDRNRDHPTRPVISVGGALVGMIRRAGQGNLNLAASLYGIIGRKSRGGTKQPEVAV